MFSKRKISQYVFLFLGVTFNIGLLCFFKYSIFIAENIALIKGINLNQEAWFMKIVLPLGISFYSFQQISFLIDTYNQKINLPTFSRYLLYVTFFPQLIAGPIVRWKDFNKQITSAFDKTINLQFLVSGVFLFTLGLCKKTLIADPIAFYFADPVFLLASEGERISTFSAWVGTIAFTFQIYFDFSGYTDMALGLAYLFGIKLPINFDSPYRATSIIDFWRRWHITLSNFLRDYLYIPLGGNKKGLSNQFFAIMVTMLIGGLWHGASWTFIFWGFLHGVFLIINHLYRFIKIRSSTTHTSNFIYWIFTFFVVTTSWVFFRSPSFESASLIIKSMFAIDGLILPSSLYLLLNSLVGEKLIGFLNITFSGSPPFNIISSIAFLGLTFMIIILFPQSQELTKKLSLFFKSEIKNNYIKISFIGLLIGLMVVYTTLRTDNPQEFIYFNF